MNVSGEREKFMVFKPTLRFCLPWPLPWRPCAAESIFLAEHILENRDPWKEKFPGK